MTMKSQVYGLLNEIFINVARMFRSAGLLSGYVAGRVASELIARFCSILILAILGVNLFLFLNVALGFWLGSLCGGSPALGFFLLSGIYSLLILSFLGLRSFFEERLRDVVADKSAEIVERAAQNLNQAIEGEELEPSVSDFIRRPVTYAELDQRIQVEQKKLSECVDSVRFDALYLKDNYKDLTIGVVKDEVATKYPVLGRFMPIWDLIAIGSLSGLQSKQAKEQKASKFYIDHGSTYSSYMPIVRILLAIVRPVLWRFFVSRIQRLLASSLGLKKWKKRK